MILLKRRILTNVEKQLYYWEKSSFKILVLNILKLFLEGTAEKKVAIAKVSKMSMYVVVCAVHDISKHLVPREGAKIVPFREDSGVQITFDEDTFEGEEVPVNLKVLLFFLTV